MSEGSVMLSALLIILSAALADCRVFNVLDFGAARNSFGDSGDALVKAWTAACQDNTGQRNVVLVPKGTFMFKNALLQGPCKARNIVFQLDGDLKAYPGYIGRLDWLSFRYVDGLLLTGGGTLDGQGQSSWHHRINDCKYSSQCGPFPANLRFDMVTNSVVQGITSLNSKSVHINLFGSKGMNISNIKIIAPEDSPNTDGIHMGAVSHIRITDSAIGTGDDCISLSPGSRAVGIHRVVCGPGHGISMGSLGGNDGEVISKVRVKDCTFLNTDNGVRIKTWPASKKGLVDGLQFQNILMKNVSNPVFIDQDYCPRGFCNFAVPSQVQVSNVFVKNIYGTSRSQIAVNLKCSASKPCRNVQLQDINLNYITRTNSMALMNCRNVRGSSMGRQNPRSCV